MFRSSLKSLLIASLIAIAIFCVPGTQGHGFLVKPKASFNGYGGGYSAIVQSTTLTPPEGKKFIWYQDQIAGIFEKALKPTKQSLRDFILKNQDTSVQAEGAPKPLSAACGFSNPNRVPQSLPDKLQWEMNFEHPGPCEVYCDDELVVPYTTDCWATFSDSILPYDKARCTGKKQLTLYFLAVHYPPWQVYINCVPLSGATAGNSTITTAAPAATTVKTAATTDKPVATTIKPAVTKAPRTAAPVATTLKPTATTAKPAPTTKAPSPTTITTAPAPTAASQTPTPEPTSVLSSPAAAAATIPSVGTKCSIKADRK